MSNSPSTSKDAISLSKYINKSDLKGLPKIDVIQLINLIAEVSDEKKSAKDAAKEFGAPYVAFAKVFVVKKTKEIAKDLINEGVKKANMPELSETDFAEKLIVSATGVATLVQQYMDHKMTTEVFIEKLGNEGIQDLAKQVLNASGMDVKMAEQLGVENLSEIGKMATSAVAFAALTAAYKMVRKAEEEQQRKAEEERRKAAQAETAKPSSGITQSRQYPNSYETPEENPVPEDSAPDGLPSGADTEENSGRKDLFDAGDGDKT